MAIKTQVLADFIAEFTYDVTLNSEMKLPEEYDKEGGINRWSLFVDRSSNQHGYGVELILQTPLGEQVEYAIRIRFNATNNEVEHEALLASLRVGTELTVESLDIYNDSQLVVNQVQGHYLTKDLYMIAYLDKVKAMSIKIKDFKICQILKEKNKQVDALANLTSAFDFISESFHLEFLPNPNIDVAKNIFQATTNKTWMDDIITYLKDGELSFDKL
ncbi:hypothetical protein Acr_00g0025320 [Actinidia rufa]|uniref:RNase H type-1 domain-containing protein n=1 Tax=Actinidia rufa TaxID=165716 RepID=A0A7J0DEN4_9ERIC|nr:hypothetical protein Acr_00g0025320 [Actinidia rufa]